MNIRNFVFRTLDVIRGGVIISYLHEISKGVECGNYDAGTLDEVLKHAVTTVPAYKKLGFNAGLKDFPVVNKGKMRECPDDYLSEKYDKSTLATHTTSGSTGTPFTIYFDAKKMGRHRAALMYWNNRAGAPLGQKLYYMRVWNEMNRKGRLSQLIENIIPVEVAHFGQADVRELLNRINNGSSPSAILGFSSAIVELTRHAREFGKVKNLKVILAMSEHLPEAVRLKAQNQFGCPVYARYSNMENGFIAQQFDDSGEYLVNTADFIIEILKLESDESAVEGEKGRIVVTDLYNYAMPFIRYDTGDLGAIKRRPDGKLVLTSVEGRKSDVITDVNGSILSPHVVTNTLWKYSEIVQFQFIQKQQRQYLLKLNLQGAKFERERELSDDLRVYLGHDAQIKFEFVDEIPVLNSGKRRYIINEMSQSK